jgi:hypothetical protein
MKTTALSLALFALTASSTNAASINTERPQKSFTGKSLVRVDIEDKQALRDFMSHADEHDLDVWGRADADWPTHVDVVMSPAIDEAGYIYETVHADLQAHFDDFFASNPICEGAGCVGNANKTVGGGDDSFYQQYQQLDAILEKMDQIDALSTLVEQFEYGKSYEGRELRGFKVTGATGFNAGKKIAILNCGLHAREWIPPSFCMYAIDQMAAAYGTDSEVTAILDKFELHTIPIANPDGYVFSMETDNDWRKSRKPNPGSTTPAGVGTDLNRNFDFQWGTGGSSEFPPTQTYMGESPFDNVESAFLAEYWNSLAPHALIQMDIHAYGNMWMQPYGYVSCSRCPLSNPRNCGVDSNEDYDRQYECSAAAVQAISDAGQPFSLRWDIGPITFVIYQASGSTADYAYGVSGIKYAYALEVRGPGFQPPTENLMRSNIELLAGVKAHMGCVMTKEGL